MEKQASIKFDFWVGLGGLTACFLVAIFSSLDVFLHPFNQSLFDWIWAGVFCVVVFLIGLLFFLKKYRLLLVGSLSFLLLFLSFSIVFSDNGPAMLGLIWLCLLAIAVGDWVLTRFILEPRISDLEWLFISFALGMGFEAVLTLILGSVIFLKDFFPLPERLFHFLHPIPVFFTLIIFSLIFFPRLYRKVQFRKAIIKLSKNWQSRSWKWESFILACLVLCLLTLLPWSLSPTIRFDSLVYHIAVPEKYVQNRGLVEIPEPITSYWAHYAEMLFTLGLLVSGQPLPSLIHFVFGLVFVGLTYTLGRRIGGERLGGITAFIIFTIPILYDSATAHNDFFVGLFAFAAIYAVILWWEEKQPGWLLVSGIFAGLGLGTKYNALPPMILLGIFILVGLFHLYGFKKPLLSGILRFCLPLFIFFVPWAILNWLWIGNPFFPYLNELFKSPAWNTDGTLKLSIEKVITNFFLLPWNLTVHGGQYYIENPGAVLGGLLLFALPWFYLSNCYRNNRQQRWAKIIAAFVLFGLFLFLPFSERVRYYNMLLPLTAILAAMNLDAVYIFFKERIANKWLDAAGVLLALLLLLTTRLVTITFGWQLTERFPYRVALGLETPEQYLKHALKEYEVLQFLNHQGNGTHLVASIGMEDRVYTSSTIYSTYYSKFLPSILNSVKTAKDLALQLSQAKIDYLIVNRFGIQELPGLYPYPVLKDPAFANAFHLLYAWNNIELYQVPSQQELPQENVSPVIGKNLLNDPGFEIDPYLTWEHQGDPGLLHPGYNSQTAVEATYNEFWFQQVPVISGSLYTMGYYARAEQPHSSSTLQIMWRDANLMLIDVSVFRVPLEKEWSWHQMSATAPEGAAFARVYAITDEISIGQFDQACFAAGDRCLP
jgi:4-amino-4-deoxy-L-arabinose transferase-like glycosyltransferase